MFLAITCSGFFSRTGVYNRFPGDNGGDVTPDPIPNSEVKLSSADDTTIGGKVGHRQGFLFFIARSDEKYSAKPGGGSVVVEAKQNPVYQGRRNKILVFIKVEFKADLVLEQNLDERGRRL